MRPILAAHPPAPASWWHRAVTDPTTLGYLALGLGCAALAGLLLWRLRAAHRNAGSDHKPDAEAGTATIEFTLVFPILMFVVLLLVQVTWAMVGNLFVHYAAFTATRSAIVQIPRQVPGEPRNTLRLDRGSIKFSAIHRAAAFSLVPVAGESSDGQIADQSFVEAIRDYYSKSGPTTPGWVESQAAGRARYAAKHTNVHLLRTESVGERTDFSRITAGQAEFNTREPITAEVRHRLHLAVPYVSVLFADGEHQTADGTTGYTNVSAQYTLTNEGVSDALPEPPPLPRNPSDN